MLIESEETNYFINYKFVINISCVNAGKDSNAPKSSPGGSQEKVDDQVISPPSLSPSHSLLVKAHKKKDIGSLVCCFTVLRRKKEHVHIIIISLMQEKNLFFFLAKVNISCIYMLYVICYLRF